MATLTAYELDRQERIKANLKRMQQVGLHETMKEIQVASARQKSHRKPPAMRQKRKALPGEKRASDRNNGRAPQYNDALPRYAIERSPASHRSRLSRRLSTGARGDGKEGWNPSKGLATKEAEAAAADAAELLLEGFEAGGKHGALKHMTESQVSGGFWSQAPSELSQHITFSEKAYIYMKLAAGVTRPQSPRFDSEDRGDGVDDPHWKVVWLPRPSGAGFSGGWRGFAIDNELHPNDTCVFEVVPATNPANSADTLVVHVFRAFDYDANAEARRQTAAEEARVAAAAAEAALLEEAEGNENNEDDVDADGGSGGGSSSQQNVNTEEDGERGPVVKVVAPRRRRSGGGGGGGASGGGGGGGRKRKRAVVLPATTVKTTTPKKQQPQQHQRQSRDPRCSPRNTDTIESFAAVFESPRTRKRIENYAELTTEEEEEEDDDEEEECHEEVAVAVEEKSYLVERIAAVCEKPDGTKLYLIKWQGYDASENTWEPAESLHAPPESYKRKAGVVL